MLWVNSLNSKGEAGGCLQVEGARKATVWKPGADEVIDAHAPLLLPDPSLKPSSASSVARLGDNGTTVGRLIAKRLTAPDQPAGPEDPEVDLPRDFVISPG